MNAPTGAHHTIEREVPAGERPTPRSSQSTSYGVPQREPQCGDSSSERTSHLGPAGNAAQLDKKTLVFVGGLHRSGTSVIAQALAEHPLISGLSNTGVIEDEGQYLQSVYPVDETYGGPGEFALHPKAHLTEQARFVVPGAQDQLLREWTPYWDTSMPVLVEKTPANLIQTRFLRALFPDAYFLIVMRHPVATALATMKWVNWRTRRRHPWRLLRLLDNWLTGYELFLRDSALLTPGRVVLVRYEDFVMEPAETLTRMWRIINVEDQSARIHMPEVFSGINDRYFARWTDSWWSPLRNLYHGRLARRLERRTRVFGYSLEDPFSRSVPTPGISRLLVGADSGSELTEAGNHAG